MFKQLLGEKGYCDDRKSVLMLGFQARLERVSDGCMEFVHPQLIECLVCNMTYALHKPYNMCRAIRHLKSKHPDMMPEYAGMRDHEKVDVVCLFIYSAFFCYCYVCESMKGTWDTDVRAVFRHYRSRLVQFHMCVFEKDSPVFKDGHMCDVYSFPLRF